MPDFEESKHPRDDHGRWTAAASAAGIEATPIFTKRVLPKLSDEFDAQKDKIKIDANYIREIDEAGDSHGEDLWKEIQHIGDGDSGLEHEHIFKNGMLGRINRKFQSIAERTLGKIDPSGDNDDVWGDWEDAVNHYMSHRLNELIQERAGEIKSILKISH